jgi:hypothetical protein
MSERFKVVPLTGYSITPRGTQGGRHPSTVWYVIDVVFAHRVMAEFKGFAAKLRAERRAARLERECRS